LSEKGDAFSLPSGLLATIHHNNEEKRKYKLKERKEFGPCVALIVRASFSDRKRHEKGALRKKELILFLPTDLVHAIEEEHRTWKQKIPRSHRSSRK